MKILQIYVRPCCSTKLVPHFMIQNAINHPLHTQSHYKVSIAIICVFLSIYGIYISAWFLPQYTCTCTVSQYHGYRKWDPCPTPPIQYILLAP